MLSKFHPLVCDVVDALIQTTLVPYSYHFVRPTESHLPSTMKQSSNAWNLDSGPLFSYKRMLDIAILTALPLSIISHFKLDTWRRADFFLDLRQISYQVYFRLEPGSSDR